jgi:hypothetical protein
LNLSLVVDDLKKQYHFISTAMMTGYSKYAKAIGLIQDLNDVSSMFEKALNEAKIFQIIES